MRATWARIWILAGRATAVLAAGCSCGDDTSTGGTGGQGGEVPIETVGGGGAGTGAAGGAGAAGGVGGAGGAGCTAPQADCNGDPADGCEVDTDTDPQHCGGCTTPCSVGSCVGGMCQTPEVLLEMVPTPTGLATDGTTLFFNSGGHASALYLDGYVASIPANGGATATLLESPVVGAEGLALDGTTILYSSVGTQGGNGLDGFIGEIPDGGSASTLVAAQSFALHFALDGSTYFWATAGTFTGGFNDGTIMKYESGQATELANGQVYPDGVAVDASYVYWTSIGTPAGSYLDGSVQRVSRSGGNVEVLVSGLDFATGLAYADGKLYFGTKNAVNVIDLASPNSYTEFEPTPKPSLFLVDGGDLFWTESSAAGRVMRKPLSGAASTLMASGILHPYGLAADATHLYFGARGTGIDDGVIYRIAR